MSQHIPPQFQAMAEALSPLSHSLAAGLLVRPVPVPSPEDDQPLAEDGDTPERICQDLDALLRESIPLMRSAMAQLQNHDPDELEELVDELAAPALDLVDMSRRIWAAALPPEAEGARPLLATLAEAPVTQLLQWILEIMHTTIDPWSIAENPEQPDVGYMLTIPDGPVRQALARWKHANPGVLPAELLA